MKSSNFQHEILQRFKARDFESKDMCEAIFHSNKQREYILLLKTENSRLQNKSYTTFPADIDEATLLNTKEQLAKECQEFEGRRIDTLNKDKELNKQLDLKDRGIDELHDSIGLAFKNREGLEEESKRIEQEYKELKSKNTKEEYERQLASLMDRLHKLGEKNEELLNTIKKRKNQTIKYLNKECERGDMMRQERYIEALKKAGTPILPSRCKHMIDTGDKQLNAAIWTKSGHLITGGGKKTVELWKLEQNKVKPCGTLLGFKAAVLSLDAVPGGCKELVLGSSFDNTVRVWTHSEPLAVLSGHSNLVKCAKFTDDHGTRVVSGSHDGTLKIWDLGRGGECARTMDTGAKCEDLVYRNDWLVSAHADGRMRVHDCRDKSNGWSYILADKPVSMDLSPDQDFILCCLKDNTVRYIDLRSTRNNEEVHALSHPDFKVGWAGTTPRFSPDGIYAAGGSEDGTVFVWNLTTGEVEKSLKNQDSPIVSCAWDPHGFHSLLSAEKNRTVLVLSDPLP